MIQKTKTTRVANHSLGPLIDEAMDFTNYNQTIVGERNEDTNTYTITHWATRIFEMDLNTREIKLFRLDRISQTTSTLVGRILRSALVNWDSLEDYVLNSGHLDSSEQKKWMKQIIKAREFLSR